MRNLLICAVLSTAVFVPAQERVFGMEPTLTASEPFEAGGAAATEYRELRFDPRATPLLDGRRDRSRARVALSIGGGNLEHDTDGSPATIDDTDAGMVRLSLEFFGERLGGGLQLTGIASDNDLFFDTAATATEATDGELFLHLTAQLGDGEHSLPLRFGPFFRGYQLEEVISNNAVRWGSFGIRGEFEPDFTLISDGGIRLSAGGLIGLGFGGTRITTDPDTFDADTTMVMFDAGLHLRLQISHAELAIGYLHRSVSYDESELVGSSFYRGADMRYDGLYVSFGLVF